MTSRIDDQDRDFYRRPPMSKQDKLEEIRRMRDELMIKEKEQTR
jgi:hypothetical protein